MGRWGDGFFEDDLALDVKGAFEEAVEEGTDPAKAAAALLQSDLANEILDEVTEDERDDAFWEESGGLFYAIATLQLEHDVLQPDVKRLTLEAIEWELAQLADAPAPARIDALNVLKARLNP